MLLPVWVLWAVQIHILSRPPVTLAVICSRSVWLDNLKVWNMPEFGGIESCHGPAAMHGRCRYYEVVWAKPGGYAELPSFVGNKQRTI